MYELEKGIPLNSFPSNRAKTFSDNFIARIFEKAEEQRGGCLL